MFQKYCGEPSKLPETSLTGDQSARIRQPSAICNSAFPASNKLSLNTTALLTIYVLILLVIAMPATAQREAVLYSFGSGGTLPYAGLLMDSAGNLYGTTSGGGVNRLGTVFELSRAVSGGWTETTLLSFNGTNGAGALSSVLMDSAGNLYSTATEGGAYGAGTAFELSRSARGTWAETALYSFDGTDGYGPWGNLIFDREGSLYGTTFSGGVSNLGTVFELRPGATGGWTENLLYSFHHGLESGGPYGGLTFDSSGNLYGTTFQGGGYADGVVFQLTQKAGGGWNEDVLHTFTGPDGNNPQASMIIDSFGKLYGTTLGGGTGSGCETAELGGIRGCGTVFELKPTAAGGWTELMLHNFANDGGDGLYPNGSLISNAAGNLYGVTTGGGAYNGGTVFELTPLSDGSWKEKILYSFAGGDDGDNPRGPLIFDSKGNLYGTTFAGGAYGNGTVFEITP